MSGYLAGRVWHSDLPSHLKTLAACLADEGNDKGEGIYPSIAYLSWKLSTSDRTVQRRMAELRASGVIREAGKKKFGRVLVPIYFLDVSKLPARAPWSEARQGDTHVTASPRGDTVVTSSVTRRGDIAVSPNPLGDPKNKPPVVPLSGGQPKLEYLRWGGEVIEVEMGNRKRLISEHERQALSGCRAESMLARLQQKRFRCRIVPKEEVAS